MINQANVPKRPEIPVKDFAETVGVTPSIVLPFDPGLFGQAANNGQMLLELQPKSPVSDGIRRLAEIVTGRVPPAELQKNTIPFLNLLMGRKQA